MAIIYSYPETLELLPADMLIGTSTIRVAGKKKNITKNFTLELLKNFILDGVTNVQWGTITGTLSNQTDLQAALNAKQNNITLTTTGSTGPATFASNVLNIPDYSAGITIPTLNQVLTAGNTSLLDAEVNTIGVYDATELAYGYLSINNSDFTLSDSLGVGSIISRMGITFSGQIGGSSGTILLSALTASRTYTLPNASGTVALTSDIPVAITSVSATSPITSSGGTTPIISTSMATNKLIGRSTAGTGVMEEITIGTGLSLSAGTLSVGSISGTIPHATATGTDTYLAIIAGVAAYGDGEAYLIRFTNGNTTGCTLNINALGAVPLYRNNDGQLIGGDIWDGGEMLCTYNAPLNIFQCIGTSPNSLFSYITNADSVAITKGQPVYAFSGTGDRLTVKRAFNTSDAGSARTIGVVVTSSIAVNQKGIIIIEGLLDNLNILPTATWSDGDTVYLGTTAGSITNVKQYAPNHLVYLGTITTASNGSSGRWYVKVQNGYELDELHNVQAQSPSLKDTLWYDNTVTPAQWKTASIPTILGYTPFNLPSLTSGSVLFSNGTTIAQDNAQLFWDDTNNRLGIGTATPSYKLSVENTSITTGIISELRGGDTFGASMSFNRGGLYNWTVGIGPSGGVGTSFFSISQQGITPRFVITSTTGNVGIGTVSPGSRLQISGANSEYLPSTSLFSLRKDEEGYGLFAGVSGSGNGWLQAGTSNDATNYNLILQSRGGNVGINTTAPTAKLAIKAGGALSTDIALRVRNSADTADLLVTNGLGNVGIGTTSPLVKLHVAGTGESEVRVSENTNNNYITLYQQALTSYLIAGRTGATSVQPLAIYTGGSEKMRIQADGNVGINTTAPTAKLAIKAPGALSTDIALRVRNSADSGDLMLVNGLGNVGIGTATPLTKLHIGGVGSSISFDTTGAVSANLIRTINNFELSLYCGRGNTTEAIVGSDNFKILTSAIERFRIVPNGNVLINTTTDVASSKLTIESTTQGFLPPRMTNAQRIAIATPAVGLCVYCTDAVEGLYINKSTGWTYIG